MRFLTVASLFVLSVFGAQLVRIQGFDAHAVAEEAQSKRAAAQIIPAMRGRILAADGTVLAASAVREVVVADQQAVCTFGTKKDTCNPETSAQAVQQAATELAPLLGTTVAELVPTLTGSKRYVILSRDITPVTWNAISDLGIPGIYRDRRETRSERIYPQGTTTAALVGYVTADGEPGGGVELMVKDHLEGTPGRQTFEQGRDGVGVVQRHGKLGQVGLQRRQFDPDGLAVRGDVADRGDDHVLAGHLCRREGDLDGERGAIGASSAQLEPVTHGPTMWCGLIAGSVRGVGALQLLGEQHVDVVAEQLFARVAQQPFHLTIDQHHLAALVDDDDAVGHRLHHFQQPVLLVHLAAILARTVELRRPRGDRGGTMCTSTRNSPRHVSTSGCGPYG